MRLRFKLTICCLLSLVLALAAGRSYSQGDVPSISVVKAGLKLYAFQDERSEVVAELAPDERLVPLAMTPGKDPWYLVRTPRGATGWIKASELQVSARVEARFKESYPSSPSPLPVPPSAQPPSSRAETGVPIEMGGGLIVVPVLLNRSLQTYMAIDTGATLTLVTPRVARHLGLKLGQRISMRTANGTTSAQLTRLHSLRVGKIEVHSLDATVKDVSLSSDPRIQGLLGLNFLSRFHTSIDSERQRLILTPR